MPCGRASSAKPAPHAALASPATGAATAGHAKVESEKIEIFSPPTFSGRSFMVQHLSHIQNLVTPEIWYNIRRFRRLISPLGASGSGFGIFLPPPVHDAEREKFASPIYFSAEQQDKTADPNRLRIPQH